MDFERTLLDFDGLWVWPDGSINFWVRSGRPDPGSDQCVKFEGALGLSGCQLQVTLACVEFFFLRS